MQLRLRAGALLKVSYCLVVDSHLSIVQVIGVHHFETHVTGGDVLGGLRVLHVLLSRHILGGC